MEVKLQGDRDPDSNPGLASALVGCAGGAPVGVAPQGAVLNLHHTSAFVTQAQALVPTNCALPTLVKQATMAAGVVVPARNWFLHEVAVALTAGHGMVGVRLRVEHTAGTETQQVSGYPM